MQSLTQFDFHQRLAETRGTALVVFSSPDCGTCRQVKRLLHQMETDGDISLFEVDVQRDTALAREFEVFHLPSLFLYQHGEFHCELHSPAFEDALRHNIAQALQLPAEEAP